MRGRGIRLLVSVALALGLVLVLVVLVLAADSDIVISEVMYRAAYQTNNQGEWIEIYNRGESAVDLTGWQIRDNNDTDTITVTMCPNNSCSIPPGGCWLIAWSQEYLQNEFNNYTNPLSPTVQITYTIFLSGKIGDGLADTADNVILKNSAGENVDCVSWANITGSTCISLTYVSGGGGQDTNLYNAEKKQSIANIQGLWYKHRTNASPYSCTNTAQGGSPTAINLLTFTARTSAAYTSRPALPLAAFGGMAMLTLGTLLWARRRRGK